MMSETGEGAVSLIVAYVARGPTKPEVPIPAPNELFVIFSSRVDTGPRMAAVRVGASHIIGFFAIFITYSFHSLCHFPYGILTAKSNSAIMAHVTQ